LRVRLGGADVPHPAISRDVAVRPTTLDWGWPQDRTTGPSYTRDDLGRHTFPIQATLSEELEDAGFVQAEESTWRDETKKGS